MSMATLVPLALKNGDRMDREEFHRRYLECGDIQGIELIEGVVYMPMPISFTNHAEPQHFAQMWIGTYALRNPAVRASGPASVFLDNRNQPEPDAILFSLDHGNLRRDGYVEGAPQLVVEVAHSSRNRDLGGKYTSYERNGVLEYIVWRVEQHAIDWFQLRDGHFERREPDENGIIESEVFPGLRLNVDLILNGDLVGVLAELDSSRA